MNLRPSRVMPVFVLAMACSSPALGQEPPTGFNTATSQPVYTWRLRDSDGAVIREFRSEFNGSTESFTWQRDFIHGAGRLLASEGDGSSPELGLIAYHTDHLGTPRFISDTLGGFLSEHHYHPFGEEITDWADGIPLKFTGHERDFADLDYMRARYYRPSLSRFLSADRQQDGWNLYTYGANNPVNRLDPSGLGSEPAQKVIVYEVKSGDAELTGAQQTMRQTMADGGTVENRSGPRKTALGRGQSVSGAHVVIHVDSTVTDLIDTGDLEGIQKSNRIGKGSENFAANVLDRGFGVETEREITFRNADGTRTRADLVQLRDIDGAGLVSDGSVKLASRAGKLVPLVGIGFAINDAREGRWRDALIGFGSEIPVVGWAFDVGDLAAEGVQSEAFIDFLAEHVVGD